MAQPIAGAEEHALPSPGAIAARTPSRPRWLEPLVARLVNWASAHPHVPLALALALAVVARLWLIARTGAMLDGDEALVGIQAERILRGARPTYFYAQPYMGSLEAYLAAGIFRIFGPSPWALRAVPVLLSLVLVWLTWRLALEMLPRSARSTPLLSGLAALLAAAPPLYDVVAELRTWGGQIEVYVLSLALLLATLRLTVRARTGGMGRGELAGRWAFWGALAGLGIWVNPLIVYALLTCGIWLLAPIGWRLWLILRASAPRLRQGLGARALALPTGRAGLASAGLGVASGGVGLALGGLPAWLYALRNGGANLAVYVTQPTVSPAVSGAARHGRLFLGAAITARYASCVAPRVLDGALPGESLALFPLRLALLVVSLGAISGALWRVARVATSPRPHADALALPLLFVGVITAIFCLGTSAWAATKSCALDYAGRYAVPLALALPLLLLTLPSLPLVWGTLHKRAPRLASARSGRLLGLLALGLLVPVQLATYATANPSQTFQSPYYDRVPARIAPLVRDLRARGITAIWANHWLGNLITFESDGQVVSADYYDEVVRGGLRRPPGTLATVLAAPDPSFLVMTTAPRPLLASELTLLGIPYTLTHLPGGVALITPARRVDPARVIPGLGQDYAR